MNHDFDQIINRRGTDAKKYDTQVYPSDCIPMWIADTDFKCPQPIIDAISKRAEEGVYGYPSESPKFSQAVVRWMEVQHHYTVDESWIKYVSGVLPAMVFAIRAFSKKNDKLLIQTPLYPPFKMAIESNERRVVENPLQLRDGQFTIDFVDLEEKLKCPHTTMLLLCNPHNPSGRVFTREELVKIGELCLNNNVFVVADEIHCDIVYQGNRHISFGSICQAFADNSLTLINPSKTFNIAGLRTGAMLIPNEKNRDAIKRQLVSNKAWVRPIFGTIGLEAAYTECDYYLAQMMAYLQANRDYMLDFFAREIPRIKVIPLEATYLAWLDCRELEMTQADLKLFMTEKAKIGLNDGTSFGSAGERFMRLNFACPKKILEEALNRLKMAVKAL